MHMRSVNFPNIVHDYISVFIRFSWNSKGSCFPGGASGKEPPANARDKRDVGLILGLGRAPGQGRGNPFQYSCLENAMDTVHRVAKVRHD